MNEACSRCTSGYIYKRPHEVGFQRRPEWDTHSANGWLSPGGEKYMAPRKESFVVTQMCNCRRRELGYPLIPEQANGVHA